MTHFKFFSFLFFIAISAFSQTKANSDTLQVNYIGQEKGLLQLNVKDIEQDNLEYLWLSTEDGLHRFNGTDFKIYLNNPLDSLSIPEDHARDTYFVNDTLFAVSNSKGAFGLKLSTDTFFKISEPQRKKKGTGYKICPINQKYLLFSLRGYCILFDRKTKEVSRLDLPKSNVENYVKDALKLDDSTFLLATSASGLLTLNIKDFSIKSFRVLDKSSHNVFYKQEDIFYVGTDYGLYCFNEKDQSVNKVLNDRTVNCIYKRAQNILWIGTSEQVLALNTKTNVISNIVFIDDKKKVYNPLTINVIRGDEKGNVWFGTEGEGMLHFNDYQKKFETLKLKVPGLGVNKKISSYQFLPTQDSSFFIGNTHGILKYNNTTKKFKHYKETDGILIYALVKDFNNDIWAGGFTSGLLKYNTAKDIFEEIRPKGSTISNRDVIQITPLSDNKLLVATWSSGLYTYKIKENEFSEYLVNGATLNRARTSLIDSKKQLWLGSDEGVFKIVENTATKHYTSETDISNISSNRVFAIKEDSKGTIWLGTNVGLTKLNVDTQKTTLYYKQKGLPNDFIYSVLIDDRDNVWVSTNKGLSVLDIKKNTFVNYLEQDGLQNNEFNGKAAFKDDFGNFYFGGINGVNVFHPQKLKRNPFEAKVHIESVELFNSPIHKNELFVEALNFKSNENVLTINFTALDYLNPQKVNYSYFLEGFDNDWRAITQNKSTTYTNLNPGNYTFKVKATNDIGDWSTSTDELRLRIIPPWYQTKWSKVSAVLLVLLLGVLFFLYKTRKLRREKIKLEALIDDRTKEVIIKKEALEIAFLKSEQQQNNIKFLMRELKHRVKNNLQIVSSLLNIQANSLEDKKAVDALKVAKNRILTISRLEDKIGTENEGIELKAFVVDMCESILKVLLDEGSSSFKVVYDVKETRIKKINTMIFGLILNELITNTVKYAFDENSDANILNIKCSIKDSKLFLIIKDNGKGYKSNEVLSSSLGVDLVKDMVAQLNGVINITSANGVENEMIIPLEN